MVGDEKMAIHGPVGHYLRETGVLESLKETRSTMYPEFWKKFDIHTQENPLRIPSTRISPSYLQLHYVGGSERSRKSPKEYMTLFLEGLPVMAKGGKVVPGLNAYVSQGRPVPRELSHLRGKEIMVTSNFSSGISAKAASELLSQVTPALQAFAKLHGCKITHEVVAEEPSHAHALDASRYKYEALLAKKAGVPALLRNQSKSRLVEGAKSIARWLSPTTYSMRFGPNSSGQLKPGAEAHPLMVGLAGMVTAKRGRG